ncbi:MAG: hypothetical protein VYC34_01540 [Planctomycetota bacterium]|nr:hypothetical protein [Planctomycetota bacterium]
MGDGKRGDKSLMRSLGLFVGHVWRGVTSDPTKDGGSSDKTVVRHDVEEEVRETPRGKVRIRRTTIEEMEVERPKE